MPAIAYDSVGLYDDADEKIDIQVAQLLCIALRNHYSGTIWTNCLGFFPLSLSPPLCAVLPQAMQCQYII